MIGYRTLNVALEIWGSTFCITTASILLIGRKKMSIGNRLLIALLMTDALSLIADTFASIFRGSHSNVGFWVLVISNFLGYACNYLLLWLFSYYVPELIGETNKKIERWKRFVTAMCCIAIACLIISQFTHTYYFIDDQNFYHRNSGFWISQIFGIFGILGNGTLLFKYRKKIGTAQLIALLSYLCLPLLALFIQLYVYGISFLNISITISLLWMYMVSQINDIKFQNRQSKRLYEQEQEMHEMKIKIMLSQIQPHFLYNALNSIYYLCKKDPEQAQEAISNFSDYLRTNLDSLKKDEPIPFEMELNHVKKYLSLEKMRFDEELKIIYDIKVTDFEIPTLTIQPLVENAVKYGVGKKTGGGTVIIKTMELEDSYIIKIIDDGVGFDVYETKQDGRTHIGITNVKQRLSSMVGGTLKIDAKRGVGTKATIILPKEKIKINKKDDQSKM